MLLINMGIQIGEYIIYPAAILLLIIILIIITAFFIGAMAAKEKKKLKQAYQITKWQKEELPSTLDYVSNEIDDPEARKYYSNNAAIADDFCHYLSRNKVWDYNMVRDISDNAPFVLSKILFYDAESSLTEYEDGEERALLLLNSIDLINGGPLYEGKKCIWMMEDIEEYPDANTPAVQNKVKSIFQQALINILDQVDEETGEINENLDVPSYIKSYTRDDLYLAAGDLANNPGFMDILPETRTAIIHGLVFSLNNYFQFEDEDVAELQICYIRSLMCVLSMKMYDEIILSLRDYKI